MKKAVLVLLSITLVISFLFIPASTSQAVAWADPIVTPLTGGKDFSVKVIDPISLSVGIAKTENGLTVPSGFPLGTMQFGGDVVIIQGMQNSTARACFSFPSYRYGWKGGIYQWNGSKWAVTPSTFTEGVEGAPATVCTTLSTDGKYALLAGYTLPPQRIVTLPVCSKEFEVKLYLFDLEESEIDTTYVVPFLYIHPGIFPVGTKIGYSIFNITPAGSLTGALAQSGPIYRIWDGGMSSAAYFVEDFVPPLSDLPVSTRLVVKKTEIIPSFTLRVTTPTCYKDFSSSDEILVIIGAR